MSAQGGSGLNHSQYETFKCLSDFYRCSIPRRKITAPLTPMLWTSSSTDSSTRVAPIVVEHDGVDDGGGGGQSIKKSSKSRRIVKKLNNLKGLEKLQMSSVRRNQAF